MWLSYTLSTNEARLDSSKLLLLTELNVDYNISVLYYYTTNNPIVLLKAEGTRQEIVLREVYEEFR